MCPEMKPIYLMQHIKLKPDNDTFIGFTLCNSSKTMRKLIQKAQVKIL